MRISANTLAVIIALVAVIGYLSVTLNSPIVFGDEGWYAGVARYMVETGVFPNYDPLHETAIYHLPLSKQPLWFFQDAWAFAIGGETGIKILMTLMPVLSGLVLYLLVRRTLGTGTALASELILVSLPGVASYGGVLNYVVGSLMLWFTVAAYFGVLAFESGKKQHIAMTGVAAGFALLTDTSGLLVIPFLVLLWFLTARPRWKELLIICVIAAALYSPAVLRTFVLCGNFSISGVYGSGCLPVVDVTIPSLGLAPPQAEASSSSAVSVIKTGLVAYSDFAFGLVATILAILGLGFVRKNKAWAVFIPLVLMLVAVMFYMNGRAEDVPRNTLFGFPGIAVLGGTFVAGVYNFLKTKGTWLAVIFAILIISGIGFYAVQKLDVMLSVKHNLDGLVTGCQWIKANTPADSIIYGIYGHQIAYQSERKVFSGGLPDQSDIRDTHNDTSYEHLKLHGFDYIVIEKFTVSNQGTSAEITPVQFVSYLDGSTHFKKVYDGTVTFGTSGITVYKIL